MRLALLVVLLVSSHAIAQEDVPVPVPDKMNSILDEKLKPIQVAPSVATKPIMKSILATEKKSELERLVDRLQSISEKLDAMGHKIEVLEKRIQGLESVTKLHPTRAPEMVMTNASGMVIAQPVQPIQSLIVGPYSPYKRPIVYELVPSGSGWFYRRKEGSR